MRRKRRAVLGGTGAVVASLAGCLDRVLDGGGDGGDDDDEEKEDDEPEGLQFAKWLHEPGLNRDWNHYPATVSQPKSVDEQSDQLPESFVRWVTDGPSTARATGIDPATVTATVGYGQTRALEVDYDADEVATELEDGAFESEDSYEGYDLYVNRDESAEDFARAIGLGDRRVVTTNQDAPDASVNWIRTVIDTRRGDETRYVEASDAMAALVDHVGIAEFVRIYTRRPEEDSNPESGIFEGNDGVGVEYDTRGEEVDLTAALSFESDSDAENADVDAWMDNLDETDGVWYDADLSASVDSRVVVITGTAPSDEIEF